MSYWVILKKAIMNCAEKLEMNCVNWLFMFAIWLLQLLHTTDFPIASLDSVYSALSS